VNGRHCIIVPWRSSKAAASAPASFRRPERKLAQRPADGDFGRSGLVEGRCGSQAHWLALEFQAYFEEP
jgi:hypothetical protein